MPDPEAVRTALARLATGEPTMVGGGGDPFPGGPEATTVGDEPREAIATPEESVGRAVESVATVDESASPPNETSVGGRLALEDAATVVDVAATAVADVDAAAAFAAGGGVPLLERAVRAAEARDDRAVVRRGQRALAAFRWVRRAAQGGDVDSIEPDAVPDDLTDPPASTADEEEPTTSAPVTESI